MSSSGSFLPRWLSRESAESNTKTEEPSLALVTGCPRSGTTAMLGWLGSQAGVVARDETRMLVATHRFLDEVDRFTALHEARERVIPALRQLCWSQLRAGVAPSARLVVEKEPLEPIALPDGRYDVFLQHIRTVLPALRIVFMVRHPVDTVSSMRNRRWGYSLTSGEVRDVTLSEAVETWRANAVLAKRLGDDPGIHICVYEALIAQPRDASHRIAAHLGLDSVTTFAPREGRPLVLSDTEQAEVMERTGTERAWFGM